MVTIPGTTEGHILIQRYQLMVQELYCAPKEEVIMASFLEQIVPTEDEPRPKNKKTTSTTKKTEKPEGSKDIRNFFSKCWQTLQSQRQYKNNSYQLRYISCIFYEKQKKFNPYLKYFFVKFSRGFIFANYQICNFLRGFNFANCTFRNILRGLNFANFGQILANREIYPTQKLIPLPYFF